MAAGRPVTCHVVKGAFLWKIRQTATTPIPLWDYDGRGVFFRALFSGADALRLVVANTAKVEAASTNNGHRNARASAHVRMR